MVEVTVRRPGQPERVVNLRVGVHTIGRADQNDLILEDVGVSRQHARVVVREDGVYVEDLGSGNGTYYKGTPITRQPVQHDDEIVIEPFMLQFNLDVTGEAPARFVARLEIIEGRSAGEVYGIGDGGASIGRAEDQTVQIRDPGASRWHASIFWKESDCVIRDENSSNGVFVNGQRCPEATLHHGDIIRISKTKLRFVTESLSAPTVPRPPSERTLLAQKDRPAAPRAKKGKAAYIVAALVFVVFAGLALMAAAGIGWWLWSSGQLGAAPMPVDGVPLLRWV